MSAEIVALVPVLDRAGRVKPFLRSLGAAQNTASVRAVFLASPSDRRELGALSAAGADVLTVPFNPGPGDWAKKINYGYQNTTEPWLLLAADDVHFHDGWADQALACAGDAAGVVGTNDLGNSRVARGEFSPHPLVRRSYADEHGTIDEHGKILHEGYDHNYPDNELAETAMFRHAWVFCPTSRVEHLHPSWRKSRMDATYRKGLARFSQDRLLYTRRQHLWGR